MLTWCQSRPTQESHVRGKMIIKGKNKSIAGRNNDLHAWYTPAGWVLRSDMQRYEKSEGVS